MLLDGLVVTILLPLLALVYGTAALGAEIEDGTAVYLLAKPVSRAKIILGKLLAAWVLTSVTVLVSALVAGAIGLAGRARPGLLLGFGIASSPGASSTRRSS